MTRRSGVARPPLDPTDVVPGPQPLDVSERDEHHVIVGEILPSGRHRAPRQRRRIAVSGALLSAAGAFVTLALMVNHGSGGVSAASRVAPGSPVPDLPGDDPTAPLPVQPGESAAPAHTAGPASTTRNPTIAVPRTPAAHQPSGAALGHGRRGANAMAWAAAIRHDIARYGSDRSPGWTASAPGTQDAARQAPTAEPYGSRHGHQGRGGGHWHGGYGR
jgi:hypothetical protein